MDETKILQAIATLGDRFDALGDRFDAMGTRVDGMGTRIDALGDRFDELGNRVDALGNRVDELGNRVDELGNRVDGLGARFDGLEQRFEAQEGQQANLEAKFDDLHRHFDVVAESLHGDIQLVAEGISALSERQDRFEVAVHQEFIATRALLEPPTRAIGRRVSHLEEDVDDLRGRVGRLESGRA